jgi:hypothetical protein
MHTSARLAFLHCSRTTSLTSRTAVYGPVRTVVWQGSAGDCRPYADLTGKPSPTRFSGFLGSLAGSNSGSVPIGGPPPGIRLMFQATSFSERARIGAARTNRNRLLNMN